MCSSAFAILLALVLLVGMASIGSRPAYAITSSCVASLDGSQEVPAVDTDGSGSATMTYDSSSNQLSWSIQFSGLSGPATAAHFHGPALGGINAGVQVNIGDISGLDSPMNGSAVLSAEQVASLLDGMMYINIHTESNPNGEIRGQVTCSDTDEGFIDDFNLEECELSAIGANDYFFLQPGYQLTLEGEEDGAKIQLIITVLNDTKTVDGVETRVVEEQESEDGQVIEISKNYFAICKETNDIFYFGEAVDIYEEGQIVSHEGAWLAGEANARPGVIIPADPVVGFKYYQEVAPGVAEDRAEIISLNEEVDTPAGRFTNVLKVEETNPLAAGEKEFKFHAQGIGLVQDANLKLVEYVLPEAVELRPLVQSVVVAGESIEVKLNSSSTISEFKLDEDNKRISFKVDGITGTAGETEMTIGRVLEGPYTVTIDGDVTTDVEVSQASGETIIAISYSHSIHEVSITGTNVVPEFPFAVMGVVAALMVTIILLGKSRLKVP